MKRDLIAPSRRCKSNQVMASTCWAIIGIVFVTFGLTWIEGSVQLKARPVLRLLTVNTANSTNKNPSIAVQIAPEMFGATGRFGFVIGDERSSENSVLVSQPVKAIRLAFAEKITPQRMRTRKS